MYSGFAKPIAKTRSVARELSQETDTVCKILDTSPVHSLLIFAPEVMRLPSLPSHKSLPGLRPRTPGPFSRRLDDRHST